MIIYGINVNQSVPQQDESEITLMGFDLFKDQCILSWFY